MVSTTAFTRPNGKSLVDTHPFLIPAAESEGRFSEAKSFITLSDSLSDAPFTGKEKKEMKEYLR